VCVYVRARERERESVCVSVYYMDIEERMASQGTLTGEYGVCVCVRESEK